MGDVSGAAAGYSATGSTERRPSLSGCRSPIRPLFRSRRAWTTKRCSCFADILPTGRRDRRRLQRVQPRGRHRRSQARAAQVVEPAAGRRGTRTRAPRAHPTRLRREPADAGRRSRLGPLRLAARARHHRLPSCVAASWPSRTDARDPAASLGRCARPNGLERCATGLQSAYGARLRRDVELSGRTQARTGPTHRRTGRAGAGRQAVRGRLHVGIDDELALRIGPLPEGNGPLPDGNGLPARSSPIRCPFG